MSTSPSDRYENALRVYLSERDRSFEIYGPRFDIIKGEVEQHVDDLFMFLISDHSLEELYFGKIISPTIIKKNRRQDTFTDYVSDHDLPETVATIDSETILLYSRYKAIKAPQNLELPTVTRVLNLDYDGPHSFFLIPNQNFRIWTDPNEYISQSVDQDDQSGNLECFLAAGKENVESLMDKRFDGPGELGYVLLSEMYAEAHKK